MGNCVCLDKSMVGEGFSPRSDPLKPLLELQQAMKAEEELEQQEEKRRAAEEGKGSAVVRVRVLLTKAEAARLMEKGVSSTGLILERLVSELEKMGRSQNLLLKEGRNTSFSSASGQWRPALESIPEVACVEPGPVV